MLDNVIAFLYGAWFPLLIVAFLVTLKIAGRYCYKNSTVKSADETNEKTKEDKTDVN